MVERTLRPVDFYVYVLYQADGTPFYVGKGRRNRWMHHEKCREKGINYRKERICAQLVATIGSVPKAKLAEHLTEAEAHAMEIATIKSIGRRPHGPLTNLTNGGEGFADRTPESIAKFKASMRAAASRPEVRARRRLIMQAVAARPGMRAKLSAILMGRPKSAETRARMSAAQSKRPAEVRAKVAAFRLGKALPAWMCLRMSEAAKRRWASPEQRAKQRETTLGHVATPETRTTMRIAQQRRRFAEVSCGQLPLDL